MTPEEYQRIFNLPFNEASGFFRSKLNIPTDTWTDLWKDQHAKGFMVAGATKAELLADFREAVQKAIDGKSTLQEFQNRFDEIVKTHGWSYKGSRNWRSELIYNTNVRTSYMAGRWQQLSEPGSRMPYLMYRHADGVRRPRPLHVSWNGLILPASHPFWQTNYPPNGWGCHCTCFAASEQERQAAIRDGKGEPPQGWQEIDPKTGTQVGIDKGWDYNVGQASDHSYKILGDKFETLPNDIARSWMKEHVAGPAFERFIDRKISGEFPVAVLDEKSQSSLGATTQTVWFSQESLIEHLDKHPDIGLADYRLIQNVVDSGEVYFQPKKGSQLERLIFLKLDGKLYRAAVKTTTDKRENFFLSLFETTEEKALEEVRKKYKRIR